MSPASPDPSPNPTPPGRHTPAPIRPCDLFSEDIHLLVDGELGVAETAVVEEHLHSCSRCLTIAARLEAMSSLLKDWDARTNDIPAPALRIRHGVLSRVKEHCARRRRESRVVGLMQYATAALVLVAIGLAAALGLSPGSDGAPNAVDASTILTGGGVAGDGVSGDGVSGDGVSGDGVAHDTPWPLSVATDDGSPTLRASREASAALAAWNGASGKRTPQLAPLTAPAGEPEWDRVGEWSAVWGEGLGRRRVAFLQERLLRQQALAQRLDTPVTFWPGPRIDAPGQRLLTISALNFLHDQGHLQVWKLATQASNEAASPTAEEPSVRVATDMTAAQMLSPMPGVDLALGSLYKPGFLTASALPRAPSSATPTGTTPTGTTPRGTTPRGMGKKKNAAAVAYLLQAWPLPLQAAGGAGSGTASGKGLLASGLPGLSSRNPSQSPSPAGFMDPLKAEANNNLRLREEDDGEGSVVFILEDTHEPIYIPAGQFIDGGFGARVVAEPVWLLPSKGKTPHIVRCRMVEKRMLEHASRGGQEGHPTLVPFVAGPTIRGLLADSASPQRVRAAAKRIFELRYPSYHVSDDLMGGWSLLDVYGDRTGQRYREIFRGRLDWKKGRGGFVVRDARGRLVGIESIRFRGPAAEELLLRLWVGYLVEAVLREGSLRSADPSQTDPSRLRSDPARRRVEVDSALASPGDEVSQALHSLANHTALFRMPAGFDASQGWRISSLEIIAAGLHMHALEVDRRPMVVSVVAGLQPTR